MDMIDSDIKNFLAKERPDSALGNRPSAAYPTTEDLYLFITDELEGEAYSKMIAHLRSHPEDQGLVAKARELLAGGETAVPRKAIEKAKGLVSEKAKLNCPHCGKQITPFRKPLKKQFFWSAVWLILAATSFGLSFVYRARFIQLTALAVLFGVKWIVDQRATKTQILIYKAMKEGETSEAKDLHHSSSRL